MLRFVSSVVMNVWAFYQLRPESKIEKVLETCREEKLGGTVRKISQLSAALKSSLHVK